MSSLFVLFYVLRQYPRWSTIVHLPIVLQWWLGKVALQWLWEQYVHYEQMWIVDSLADVETTLIEEQLPHTVVVDE